MWLKKLKNNRILAWVIVTLVVIGLVAAYVPLLFVAPPPTQVKQEETKNEEAEPLSFLFSTTTAPTAVTTTPTSSSKGIEEKTANILEGFSGLSEESQSLKDLDSLLR